MKKWIFALLLLLGIVLSAVSCTKEPGEIERNSVPTKTETDAPSTGTEKETGTKEETGTEKETGTGKNHLSEGGANTASGFGELIPPNGKH